MQDEYVKEIIRAIFEKHTDLSKRIFLYKHARFILYGSDKFAQIINRIKSSLSNPNSFDQWIKDEYIELGRPEHNAGRRNDQVCSENFPLILVEFQPTLSQNTF